ncbi:hypothetical protein [Occultella gossypii]|uniref:PLD phosphodiesterase domain-containing protein n=1 Tax=Occultella gossypii TaxID=2800820 RepID=A0ABS7S5R0_9MICO|nr:hypothetical protein [Occultella gossypii]MBZ2195417.1 hypothetical protein [Occultella gossypii]
MLSPETGVTLLESLTPPAGYRLDVAVGTSYTLDLAALLAVPTAFALSATTEEAGTAQEQTPLALLEALRRHARSITLFADAARIAVPRNAVSGVLGFLEGSVVPVSAPRGGAFHPKLWLIRFTTDDGVRTHRVLVASRNLTFDRSWDTMVCLEQSDEGQPLPQVAELLHDLMDLPSTARLTPERAENLRGLAESVAAARFGAPSGFDTLRLHPIGFRDTDAGAWPFPESSNRALVMAPFLSPGYVSRVEKSTRELSIVSRADELDRAFDGRDETRRPPAFVINPNLVDDSGEQVLTDLHAKVFVHDVPGSRTHVFAGSANATGAAFGQNTEVLLEMVGPTYKVGVRTWLDEKAPTLRQMLLPHTWSEPVPAQTPAEEALRHLQDAIAKVRVTATVDPESDGWYSVTYAATEPFPPLGAATLEVRPVTVPEWSTISGTDLTLTSRTGLTGLTSFLAVRIGLDGEVSEFVLACDLVNAPDDREDRLLAHLISNPARLVRYLLMLLADQAHDKFDGIAQELERASRAQQRTDLETLPLLEMMLRAAVRYPERLQAVGRLMDVVRNHPELSDESLVDLWDAISVLVPAERAR